MNEEPDIFDDFFAEVTSSATYRAAKEAQAEQKTEIALALMQELVRLFPKHPLARYALGEAFMEACQNDQAMSSFRLALDLAREDTARKDEEAQTVAAMFGAHMGGCLVSIGCWKGMAAIHMNTGEMGQARQCLALCVSEFSEDEHAWKGLLEISKLTGNERIHAHACRGLSRFGGVPMPYWTIRIKRFLRARRYRAALAACRQAMKKDPDYPGVWRLLGKTYAAMAEQARHGEGRQLCLSILRDVYRQQAEQAYLRASDRSRQSVPTDPGDGLHAR